MTEPATHEAHPPKSTLQRLIEALSMHGADLEAVGGGIPEMEPCDWAGALSGSGDPMGEEVVCVRYLDKPPSRLVRALNLWGWNRLMERGSRVKLSAGEHQQLSAIAVEQHAGWSHLTREDVMERMEIGRSRYDALRGHHVDLVTRLVNGESRALDHLARRVR